MRNNRFFYISRTTLFLMVLIVFFNSFRPENLIASQADSIFPEDGDIKIKFDKTGKPEASFQKPAKQENETKAFWESFSAECISPYSSKPGEAVIRVDTTKVSFKNWSADYNKPGLFAAILIESDKDSNKKFFKLPQCIPADKFKVAFEKSIGKALGKRHMLIIFTPSGLLWPFPPNNRVIIEVTGDRCPVAVNFPGPCISGAICMKNPGISKDLNKELMKTRKFWSEFVMQIVKKSLPESIVSVRLFAENERKDENISTLVFGSSGIKTFNLPDSFKNIDWKNLMKNEISSISPVTDLKYSISVSFFADDGSKNDQTVINEEKELMKKVEALLKAGNEIEALECFENALKLNPKNFKAWKAKGEILEKSTNYLYAYICYKKWLATNYENNSNMKFVASMYLDIIKRMPEEKDIKDNHWYKMLESRKMSKKQLLTTFVNSPEKTVIDCFKKKLNRIPRPSERTRWIKELEDGKTPDEISKSITEGSETQSKTVNENQTINSGAKPPTNNEGGPFSSSNEDQPSSQPEIKLNQVEPK